MLWTIAVILLVLWLLGLVSSYTVGGFIHVLLVIAIVVILINVIQGRKVIVDPGMLLCNGSLAGRRRDEHNQDRGHRADRGRPSGSGVRQVQLHQGDPRSQARPARTVG